MAKSNSVVCAIDNLRVCGDADYHGDKGCDYDLEVSRR